ncbi:HepT-like ribonuclease domain-containing protein [Nakamurella aerolata]|uniref:DUF86 domain-containing protein n=1 Tax=Nakamurella aerolata TaxID=1656892 RepID=A0A849ACX4_9ACTN|nr:HepT-like ribonuclease domain-containing protein [Nakamurella aerolata]NNG37041.1 DUF86 domain-containing protein [Nakamurella aerolata]
MSNTEVTGILVDMLRFADEIDEYVVTLGEENFYTSRPTQLVAEALLHRLGEAVARLDRQVPRFIASHPEIEWGKMKGMRNIVAHEYGFIDYRIVWRALTVALPRDVRAIRALLE